MRKILLALFVSAITWSSCTKDNTLQPLSKTQIKQKVDSIMVGKSKMLEGYGKKDLETRMKIEVKAKADSIMNARHKVTVKDTTKPAGAQKHQ